MSNNKDISRRDFLKTAGIAAAATAGLSACNNQGNWDYAGTEIDIPTGQMTYRTNPTTGDKVSILGYGCMRWPTVKDESARVSPPEKG